MPRYPIQLGSLCTQARAFLPESVPLALLTRMRQIFLTRPCNITASNPSKVSINGYSILQGLSYPTS